ncbi:MAG: 8-amino-7-oxononanoate synthase [Steroidobacteraceae bacterium]
MHYSRRLAEQLDGLKSRGDYRQLTRAAGADYSSNDYLALAHCTRIREALRDALRDGVPHGAGGSRLLRGNHAEHERLEADAAAFFGSERAVLFGSGYAANTALYAALPGGDDLVVYDERVHASAHDGMKLGRAESAVFKHNDVDAAEAVIRAWRVGGGSGVPWLAVESVYSMDGDRAPLDDLDSLARRYDGNLLIDEAHATGVFGPDGRGLGAHLEGCEHVITLHTGGKALGVSGALVTCSRLVSECFINRARPFIFATAPPPLIAVMLGEALRILADEPARRARLAALIAHARNSFAGAGLRTSESQIVPVLLGESARAVSVAAALQTAGFDVRAVRPPSVPPGTARLRVSITLHVDERSITALTDALKNAGVGM